MATGSQRGSLAVIRRLVSFLSPWRRKFLGLLLVGSVVAAATETIGLAAIALYASSIASPDAIVQTGYFKKLCLLFPTLRELKPSDLTILFGLVVTLFVIFKNSVRGVVVYGYSWNMAYMAGYYADKMLNGFLRMPYQWVIRHNSADLVREVNWARTCGVTLGTALSSLSDIMFLFFLLGSLVAVDAVAVLLALGMLGVPALILSRIFLGGINRLSNRRVEHERVLGRALMMALQGVKDIKLLCKEESFCDKYRTEVYAVPRLQAKVDLVSGVSGWVLEAFGFLMLTALVFLMYSRGGESSQAASQTIAFLAVAAWRGLPAIMRVVTYFNTLRSQMPMLESTLSNLETIGEQAEALALSDFPIEYGTEITFNDVSFSYEGSERQALSGVNFTIHQGEYVGLVGESGAGKSTLVDVLVGLLKPTGGEIVIDGKKMIEGDRLKFAGYVPQSPYICDATLAENIALGEKKDEIDRDRVRKACELAALGEVLELLEDGIDSELGEHGVRLSGGQQQRICVARALYNNPSMLIFDEATSSLDAKSERQIMETIKSLKGKVTMLIVAHRLSTVEGCDRLVWMGKGKVRKVGTVRDILPAYRTALNESD